MHRRDGGRRMRVLFAAAIGALCAVALVPYAPDVPALAERGKHPLAVQQPDQWNKQGSYLPASQAYPSVVRILDGDGSPSCSGSVVHSPGGDLVITAAHCVYSQGSYTTGLSVAPDTSDGKSPHGTWDVDRIWVDPHYAKDGDETYDYAFLRVSRSGGPAIEAAVGANTLAVNQPFHLRGVTTTGYPDTENPDDRQLTCTLETFQSGAHDQYREARCGGYFDGVSGGPWVLLKPGARTGTLVGVIGGWNNGGPDDGTPHADAISYSPYFTDATKALYEAAMDGESGESGQ
jgi:hypothetical protein